jgi:hypothetical protein
MSLFDWEWPIEQAKAVLIAHLKTLGYTEVRIGYDGIGDEGGITDIEADKADGSTTQLPLSCMPVKPLEKLSSVLENFAWKVLDEHHDGFEIDDGAFGTVTLNVTTRKLTLERNDRFTSFETTTVEV